MLEFITLFFGKLIFLYLLFVVTVYILMLIFSTFYLRKQFKLDRSEFDASHVDSFYSKPVSIIVPAYNEEMGIIDSVHSLLSLRYPNLEIIIVNDGSTDRTQEIVIEHFEMKPIQRVIRKDLQTKQIVQLYQSQIHPNCILVEKENGGKADALNAGINISKYPYFCSLDGDSILEETALLRIMRPITLSDGEVIAVGGNVRIANDTYIQLGSVFQQRLSHNYLVIMQIIEYLRAFLMGRTAFSKFNILLVISGAFSVFSKKWVVEAGGYLTNSLGEDMELIVHLQRLIYEKKSNNRIEFLADSVCWTEAPQTLKILRRQRRRWHQGLLESLWKHKKMMLNPKYGAVGCISMPYFLFVECLGPIIELSGYIYVLYSIFNGSIYYEMAIALSLLFFIYGSLFSAISILFEAWSLNKYPTMGDTLRLVFIAFSEVFWYRPLTLFWRLEGIYSFLTKKKNWGVMERIGMSQKGKST